MRKRTLVEFAEYAAKYVEHYGVWPRDYEDSTGKVWPRDECLESLKEYPSLEELLRESCKRVWEVR